jgi:hypothetical protein
VDRVGPDGEWVRRRRLNRVVRQNSSPRYIFDRLLAHNFALHGFFKTDAPTFGCIDNNLPSKESLMRNLEICVIVTIALLASVAMADPSQRSLPIVSTKDLDDCEAKLKADSEYLTELLAKDRDKAEALIRAGQKQRPAARLWSMDVQTLFAVDRSTGKRLQGKEKIAHFQCSLEYLQESYKATVDALKKAPHEQLQEVLLDLQIDLALAALEAGETELAKKHAAETLSKNTDGKNWNYGNIIHDGNQILGRGALREGRLADAKTYLLKAGATPGSPQLNSFGPQMQLARELLETGEKEAVLQYLDLVSKFWVSEKEQSELSKEHAVLIAGWKREIAEGKIPTGSQWR